MAGYSGTPLPQKLGIKEGMTLGILGAPESFAGTLGSLPAKVTVHHDLASSNIFIVFGQWADELDEAFHQAAAQLPPDGAIWVAWPKRRSGVETDITEDTLRDLFLSSGMVDNKVCAIDDTWSGLRFVVRKENRATWPS
ncbi:MAG TPA: DUF3052 domain-containing protein [Acidimicrobiia bacterium]|nr:DUF3052 domain-containing protein [Acidimicrobiia bacterium]